MRSGVNGYSQGTNAYSYRPSGLTIAANGDVLLAFDDATTEHPDLCQIIAFAP
jgi:hypothetical protein